MRKRAWHPREGRRGESAGSTEGTSSGHRGRRFRRDKRTSDPDGSRESNRASNGSIDSTRSQAEVSDKDESMRGQDDEKKEEIDREESLRWEEEERERQVEGAKELERQRQAEEELREAERLREEDSQRRIAEAEEQARLASEEKMAMRFANLEAASSRPSALELKNLESSVKKNTTFIRKLRSFSENNAETLLQEAKGLNQSRYISEAVSALVEAKIKGSDVASVVKLCCFLHQRYGDFDSALYDCLYSSLVSNPNPRLVSSGVCITAEGSRDVLSDPVRKRTALRLLTELFFVGLGGGDGSPICDVVSQNLAVSSNSAPDFSFLISFLRYGGADFVGLKTESCRMQFCSGGVSDAVRSELSKKVASFFDASVAYLTSEGDKLRQMEVANAKSMRVHGELAPSEMEAYHTQRKSFDRTLSSVTSLANIIGKEVPILEMDEKTTRVSSHDVVVVRREDEPEGESPWDDDDQRAFYEDIPDLKAQLPPSVFGEEQDDKADDKLLEDPKAERMDEMTAAMDNGVGEEKSEEGGDGDDADEDKAARERGERRNAFDAFLAHLPECFSRDRIDAAATEFCSFVSKGNKRRLVRVLVHSPRTLLELLPHYARLVATLNRVFPEISTLLLSSLESQFEAFEKKKDQVNIESKVRNVRFFGELAKFRVCPPSVIFHMMRTCLDDFSHHNVIILCELIECCGSQLYRWPETNQRCTNLLETMMRLRKAKSLSESLDTMVAGAFYACIPPERVARKVSTKTVMEQFVRKIVVTDLSRETLDDVFMLLRRLPWPGVTACVAYYLSKVRRVRYSSIRFMAVITARLSRYHGDLSVRVVDRVLEQIRRGLEVNAFSHQQERLALMKLLGELYVYKLVGAMVIFDVLYLVLSFPGDSPDDFFRVRLIASLLEVCGRSLMRGKQRRQIDKFLVFFQASLFGKVQIPLEIEFVLSDLFSALRLKRMMSDAELSVEIAKWREGGSDALAVPDDEDDEAEAEPEPELEVEMEGATEEAEIDEQELLEAECESDDQDEGTVVVLERDETEGERLERIALDDELAHVIQTSLDTRRLEHHHRNLPEISVPMSIQRSSLPTKVEDDGDAGVPFRVLVKSRGKASQKSLLIPEDAPFVQNKDLGAIEAQKMEQAQVKRKVLEYQAQQEASEVSQIRYLRTKVKQKKRSKAGTGANEPAEPVYNLGFFQRGEQ